MAGRADRAVDFLQIEVQPRVASRHHHGDTGRSGTAHRRAQRVRLPRLRGVGCQADVEHPDVVFLGVVDHPLDAFQRIAERAVAVVVEYLDVVEVGVGRDAGGVGCAGAVRLREPGGHRGHMGAMPVAVSQRRRVVRNRGFIGAERGAARLWRSDAADAEGPVGRRGVQDLDVALDARGATGVEEGLVRFHDARVQYRDADAGAVDAAVARFAAAAAHIRRQRAGDGFERARGAQGDAVGGDADDVAALRQCGDVRGLDLHRQGAYRRVGRMHRAADAGDVVAQIAQLRVGVVADDDGLHVAHAADVARPLGPGCAGLGDLVAEVARHLLALGLPALCGVGRGEAKGRQQHGDRGDRGHGCLVQAAALDQHDETGGEIHVISLGGEGRGRCRATRIGSGFQALRLAEKPPPQAHRSAVDWLPPLRIGMP